MRDQPLVVARVEADRRLVEHVERVHEGRADRGRQVDALRARRRRACATGGRASGSRARRPRGSARRLRISRRSRSTTSSAPAAGRRARRRTRRASVTSSASTSGSVRPPTRQARPSAASRAPPHVGADGVAAVARRGRRGRGSCRSSPRASGTSRRRPPSRRRPRGPAARSTSEQVAPGDVDVDPRLVGTTRAGGAGACGPTGVSNGATAPPRERRARVGDDQLASRGRSCGRSRGTSRRRRAGC